MAGKGFYHEQGEVIFIDLFLGHCRSFDSVLDDSSQKNEKRSRLPYDHPDSSCQFQPNSEKPVLATPNAIEQFGRETILACLHTLQAKAIEHAGIDYLQVFEFNDGTLWFIEDGEGGAITALLPSEY